MATITLNPNKETSQEISTLQQKSSVDTLCQQMKDKIDQIFEERNKKFEEKYCHASSRWLYMYRSRNASDVTFVKKAVEKYIYNFKNDVQKTLKDVIAILNKSEPDIEKIISIFNAKTTIKYTETETSLAEGCIHYYCTVANNGITGKFLSKDPSVLGDYKAHWEVISDIVSGKFVYSENRYLKGEHFCNWLRENPDKELQKMGLAFDKECVPFTL